MQESSMRKLRETSLNLPKVLLPAEAAEMEKWAVIACDQFTSQPEYWRDVEKTAGESPSTLKITLPEIYLDEADERVPKINARMEEYLAQNLLPREFSGFVLVKRQIGAGIRTGLLALLDLEAYDFSRGSKSPIRATEGTIISRLPPRVKIRENAPLELPHILVLIDDPEKTVIEPLLNKTGDMELLYDFDLMLGGGHITGYGISEDSGLIDLIASAIDNLAGAKVQAEKYGLTADEISRLGRMTFAMGDGNHSLATAKTIWERTKQKLPADQWEDHLARYALVELNNLHEESLQFEPIHRLLENCRPEAVLSAFESWANAQQGSYGRQIVRYLCGETGGELAVENAPHSLPVGTLQLFLDEYISANGSVIIDYIHGDDALFSLAQKAGSLGFLCEAIEKPQLFKSILLSGPLPRKTFSIGNARDKRYYLEARRIK
ncbi:MAG: DUF1015 domain-containing protein [Christensenellales bacterium]|jgi:hypothetical protein